MNKDSIKLIRRSILTWLLFIPIVVLNGAIREEAYKPLLGELLAHQVSTLLASIAFLVLAYFLMKKFIRTASIKKLFLIGGLWVLMTVSFELILGRFILGYSWKKLLYDYNISKGRIWTLLLFIIFITPILLKQTVKQQN